MRQRTRINRRRFVQAVGALGLAGSAGGLGLGGPGSVSAQVTISTLAHELSTAIDGRVVHSLPFAASHIAVYWKGEQDATVTVAFSADGAGFSAPRAVTLDEVGKNKHDGWTYGAVMLAGSALALALNADRALGEVRVVAMVDGERTVSYGYQPAAGVQAAVPMPPVISRAGWGCNESLMTWPPDFYPVQKLICHHTATQNNDPDPAATVRAIYYYHAVTEGWGDIGYNFLVDEEGRIYEGRYSRVYAPGEYPTGENLIGYGVTGAHAYQYNSGTVGIALIGNLVSQDATPAARRGLEQMLAWNAEHHGIDPNGRTVYTNPVTSAQTTFPDLAGHCDVNATECPGGDFYATLPVVRDDVAAMIGSSGTPAGPAAPVVSGLSPSGGPTGGGTTVTVSGSGFTGATAVDFGAGNPGSGLKVVSDSQLTVVAPARAAGVVDVTVTTTGSPSSVVAADRFSYAPSVTGLSPSQGSAGTTVTVSGSGFTGASAVDFGGVAATGVTVDSDSRLTVLAPAGSGTVDVTVTSGGVTSATSAADQFSYTASAPPSFTLAVSPPSQSISRYGTARYDATLTAANGFSTPVALSVSGLPWAATASFSPSAPTPSGSSTLTVNSRGVPGTFILTITASGGGVTQSSQVRLTVTNGFWW